MHKNDLLASDKLNMKNIIRNRHKVEPKISLVEKRSTKATTER